MVRCWGVRRLFAHTPKSPWRFGQTQSPVPLKPLTVLDQAMFRSQVPAGFSYAYLSLIEALGKHDYAALAEFLEGRLYHHLEAAMKEMEIAGYHMELADGSERQPEIRNVGVYMGVNIQRIKNPPREDYFQIASLEQVKSTLNADFVKKMLASRGVPSSFDLFAQDLSNCWVYLAAKAPGKVVISADVIYRGPAPLRLVKKGTEIGKTGGEEVHMVRFESEGLNLGSQADMASKGLSQLPNILSGKMNLLEATWEIADIDHFLQGNPFVLPKKELVT